MPRKKTIRDVDVEGKTVLVRADFNVTFVPGTTAISDDSRIRATLPTIENLVSRNAKVVLCSHLGRPNGRVSPELRMQPVSDRLAELLGHPVTQTSEPWGADVWTTVEAMQPREVVVLENLRFDPREESNDPSYAKGLASLADVYVNDAFGAAHRAHASTEGVTKFLPSVAGLLMERELEMLGAVLDSPRQPLVAIVGGAKVSDKLPVIGRFTGRAKTLLVGGGMAATFLKSQGLKVGDSLVEEELIERAGDILSRSEKLGTAVLSPTDVVVSSDFSADAMSRIVDVSCIESGWRIMDIGPETAERYANALSDAGTVLWNGTMGVFEWPAFSAGTKRLAEALAAQEEAITVIGGGSTAEAVISLGLADRMTHVSTGGGASLEFLEGRELPGVAGLLDAD
ncbi:MAG: phosphoglycerate kinase [Chloroflexota bacterium]|nr:phosphoglycerate kinase [Chloroflexota bacterium]